MIQVELDLVTLGNINAWNFFALSPPHFYQPISFAYCSIQYCHNADHLHFGCSIQPETKVITGGKFIMIVSVNLGKVCYFTVFDLLIDCDKYAVLCHLYAMLTLFY